MTARPLIPLVCKLKMEGRRGREREKNGRRDKQREWGRGRERKTDRRKGKRERREERNLKRRDGGVKGEKVGEEEKE